MKASTFGKYDFYIKKTTKKRLDPGKKAGKGNETIKEKVKKPI
jgi:hypothetical protein